MVTFNEWESYKTGNIEKITSSADSKTIQMIFSARHLFLIYTFKYILLPILFALVARELKWNAKEQNFPPEQ